MVTVRKTFVAGRFFKTRMVLTREKNSAGKKPAAMPTISASNLTE
jgi:hypothetical protein